MVRDLYDALADIVGPQNVSANEHTLMCYSVDTNPLRSLSTNAKPDFVVLPSSVEEIAKIMKLANNEKIPVSPRGAGTSRVGASLPLFGGIVLDLNRMNRILEVNEKDMWARIQPGCTFRDLSKALENRRLRLPIEPDSFIAATIGGNISTDGAGWQLEKYGDWSSVALALQVVLPTGQIIKTGCNLHKSATGYNLTSLFVGSEGTLGIITEITLRVIHKPEAFEVKYIGFRNFDAAFDAGSKIIETGMIPAPASFWDETRTAEFFSQRRLIEKFDVQSIAALGFAGCSEEVDACWKKTLQICSHQGGIDVGKRLRMEATRDWAEFRLPPWPVSRRGRKYCSESAIVPFSKARDVVDWYKKIALKHDITPEGCTILLGPFRLGAFSLSYSFDDTRGIEAYKTFSHALMLMILHAGGSITYGGTGGIGERFAAYMTQECGSALPIMKEVKKTLDPNNIMNPGKIFETERYAGA